MCLLYADNGNFCSLHPPMSIYMDRVAGLAVAAQYSRQISLDRTFTGLASESEPVY